MGLKQIVNAGYPPRHWAIVGFPGVGKSTFIAQMRQPTVVIDADHRFKEVARSFRDGVFMEFDNPQDYTNPRRIAAVLDEAMPTANVGTIAIDSLTSIIVPLVTEAQLSNAAGENKNRVSAFADKALAMRTLQDAITKWGADTAWIYHLRESRDANAKLQIVPSISEVELARLRRSLNMVIRLTTGADGRRTAIVDWSRSGRSGVAILDQSGSWVGMPERIEEAVYANMTEEEREESEKSTPRRFADPADAIAWGYEQGCFNDAVHAKNAYDKVKADHRPTSANEMWRLWVEHVLSKMITVNEEKELEP